MTKNNQEFILTSNPYPAVGKSDMPLTPVQNQARLHIGNFFFTIKSSFWGL